MHAQRSSSWNIARRACLILLHLMPLAPPPFLQLHVAFGAGKGDTAQLVFSDIAMGVSCSSVQW